MKNLFAICLILLLSSTTVWGQVTNGGQLVFVTEGTVVSFSNLNSSGVFVNNGTLSFTGDLLAEDFRGSGNLTLRGQNQSVDLSAVENIGSLTINGGGIKSFAFDLNINGDLRLLDGIIESAQGTFTVTPSGRVLGGDNFSFVRGKLIQSGQSTLTFPVGVANQYRPVTLTFSQPQVATLGMSYFNESPNGSPGFGAIAVSEENFWELTVESGSFNGAQVALPMRGETVVNNLQEIIVVGNAGTSDTYRSYGRLFTTGNIQTGTLHSESPVPAGRFTFGKFFDEQLRVNDSLALVSLYQSTKGSRWTNRAGWTTAGLDNWFGVDIDLKRVTGIALPENNLDGIIPEDAVSPLSELTQLDLSGNKITGIPSFNNLTNLAAINVSNNRLGFASLESQEKLGLMEYIPQANVLTDTSTVIEFGQIGVLDRRIAGRNNEYRWEKDGDALTGGTRGELFIQNARLEDEGFYNAVITNTAVPGLTLTSNPIELFISSRERDIAALLELYNRTEGNSWQHPTGEMIQGWDADTDISEWSFLELNSTGLRVLSINLNGVGLKGEVPNSVSAMTFVRTLDLANNDITRLPRLAGIPNLNLLDVTNNRLQYASLQRNIDVPDFRFSPQKPLSEPVRIVVPQGTPHTFELPVLGEGLTYQWTFNGTNIPGATTDTYTVDSVNFEDMGDYQIRLKDEIISAIDPNFSIATGAQRLLATASLSGEVFNNEDQAVNGGAVTLWGIRPQGQVYDSVGTFPMTGNAYTINDVVLDDYILIASTDPSRYLPTYHTSAVTWSIADRVQLRSSKTGVNIRTLNIPEELIAGPDNDNIVRGTLEIETDNFPPGTFPSGRTLLRKRVARAGVSFSRARSIIRSENEFDLVAYQVTDENGTFEAINLPRGLYRINIEYPGIPMDPTTFIEFELGEDQEVDENILELFAEIKPLGIAVEKVSETGVRRNYFRELAVFPNPATNYINVNYEKLNSNNIVVQIIDMSGALRLQQSLPRGVRQSVKIDVSTLTPGLYVVSFTDDANDARHVASTKIFIAK